MDINRIIDSTPTPPPPANQDDEANQHQLQHQHTPKRRRVPTLPMEPPVAEEHRAAAKSPAAGDTQPTTVHPTRAEMLAHDARGWKKEEAAVVPVDNPAPPAPQGGGCCAKGGGVCCNRNTVQGGAHGAAAVKKEEDGDVAMATPNEGAPLSHGVKKEADGDVAMDPVGGDATMAQPGAPLPTPPAVLAIVETPLRRTRSGKPPSSRTPASSSKKKTAKRKSTGGGKKMQLQRPNTAFPNDNDDSYCYFCGIPGNQPACEGELLGPFKVAQNVEIYAHRACITWAPEVYTDPPVEGEATVWRDVEKAYARAKYNKCHYCKGPHAPLGCTFGGKKCCRPMHFRCALLMGATFNTGDYNVQCHTHAARPANGAEPVPLEQRLTHTPVDIGLIAPSSTASCCDKDNFDFDRGHILHCGKCRCRIHSKCLAENFEFGGIFSIMASKGHFRCRKCMTCAICDGQLCDKNDITGQTQDMSISAVYTQHEDEITPNGAPAPGNTAVGAKKRETVTCVNCHHVTVHRDCVKGDVSDGWRCDTCRCCYHCMFNVAKHEDWRERNQACWKCDKAIEDGGAICPSCSKVWREDVEGVAMIQCDTCNKWLHDTKSCSGLTPEEYEVMVKSDDVRYDCPTCLKEINERKRSKMLERIKSKQKRAAAKKDRDKKASKKKRDKVADMSDEEEEEVLDMYYGSSDEEDGASFKYSSKALKLKGKKHACVYSGFQNHEFDPNDVSRDAGPCAELCAGCSTSDFRAKMRYCWCCGDGYHGFCLESKLPEQTDLPLISSHPGTKYRHSAGGLGEHARPWVCPGCTVCQKCGEEDPTRAVVLCDHCDRGTHISCLSPPLDTLPEGDFFCDECRSCEMCNAHEEFPLRVRDHLFCKGCAKIVENSKPCSVCRVLYPIAAGKTQCGKRERLGCNLPHESQSMELTGALCTGCNSLIHSDCDPSVEASASYRCPVCRSGKTTIEDTTAVDVTSDMSGCSDECKHEGTCSLPANGITKHDSDSDYTDAYSEEEPLTWRVDAEDRRRCELCLEGEGNPLLGRLIPVPPDTSGTVQDYIWMHAACMFCCEDTAMMVTENDSYGILARRKEIISMAKKTTCNGCGKNNATVKCSHKGCRMRFHLGCAEKHGVMVDPTGNAGNTTAANRPMYCKIHAGSVPKKLKTLSAFMEEDFDLKKSIRVIRLRKRTSHDGNTNSNEKKALKAANAKPETLVRVGGLSVLSFGRLMVETGAYLIKDTLVPSGYRATKKFWSMKRRGKRCMYQMEVRGDASWGPEFVVWNSEDESDVVKGLDIDEAWDTVRSRVSAVSHSGTKFREFKMSKEPRGLEAFGLTLKPVVTLIESLPMAWMFKKRYTFKYRTPTSKYPNFEERLLRRDGFNFDVAPANSTGCARTQGYVPKKRRDRGGFKGCPSYSNHQSGLLFQVGVAMENEGFAHLSPNAGHSHLCPPSDGPAIKVTLNEKGRRNKILEGAKISDAARYKILMDMKKLGRMKHVVLRSRIAGFGMFATEDIKQGDIIDQYKGELIRPCVSDIREPKYEEKLGSLYLFKLQGSETGPALDAPVIDATVHGGLARYINHSCDVNCIAKEIVTHEGEVIIVIIALRDIARGEEFVYDYLLSTPDGESREPCLCGATKCRGFMDEPPAADTFVPNGR